MTMRITEKTFLPPLPNPLPKGEARLSSVLAIIGWNSETEREEILLTKRTERVETHKGQVSFPGGHWEKHDTDLLATALRESHEEIGLPPDKVQVLGGLEPVRTRGDILVYPWVGHLAYPFPFQINPDEVDSILYLPLLTLLEEGTKPVTVKLSEGIEVESRGLWVGNDLVWGATARMLEQLREKILTAFR